MELRNMSSKDIPSLANPIFFFFSPDGQINFTGSRIKPGASAVDLQWRGLNKSLGDQNSEVHSCFQPQMKFNSSGS